ncbi:MAG: Gfo/Idh/MocA family oxidoreductase [Phycisphaerae bacterium]|nr:Gfo/Idh/MocA family oxidoreductase [Phycisphaerae bacterium]
MSKTYGFGIIGTGMIGNFHAKAINELPNAKLIAAFDQVEERAKTFADQYGIKAYSTLDRFLEDPQIDVVTIGTPSGSHMEPTVSAAKFGKHVICEKPLEVTLSRIDEMIEAHQKAGTKLGGVFNSRYEPVNQMLKKVVSAGRLGRITYGAGYVPWFRSQEYYDQGGWRGTWKFDGGGALMNQGTHTVDLLRWLMGSEVKRISAFTALLGHERLEVEDTAAAALEFANGALGILFATTALWPGQPARVELGGTGGMIVSETSCLKTFKFAQPEPGDEKIIEEFGAPPIVGGASDPKAISADNHRRNFETFLKALDAGVEPELNGVEARKAVQIVLSVYESARTGKPVEIR